MTRPYRCSRCDEPGHTAPNCPGIKDRLCRIELVVDGDRFAGELFPAGEVALYRWSQKSREWDSLGRGLLRDGYISGFSGGSVMGPKIVTSIERALEAFNLF